MASLVLSVILVTWNDTIDLINCLKDLEKQTFNNFEVIIVENGSKEENLQLLKNFLSKFQPTNQFRLRIFYTGIDDGYTGGNNYGAKRAEGELLLILNPDTILKPKNIESLLNRFKKLEKRLGTDKILLNPRLCTSDGKHEFSKGHVNFLGFGLIDCIKTEECLDSDFISGGCFLIKTKYFKNLKGFDESYFMYHDDLEFSLRARLEGFRIVVENKIFVLHNKTLKDYQLTPFKYYYIERNRFRTILRYSHSKKLHFFILLLFEPILLAHALVSGFLKCRFKIYKYLIQNISNLFKTKSPFGLKKKFKFSKYKMDGVMDFFGNRSNSGMVKLLNLYSKFLYYIYYKRLKKLKVI
ncbi:MAG: glycosyltransferase family 2 protein [Candidatus Hodarchaeota archaeon]